MNPALGSGAFTGDYAVTHHSQCEGRRIAARNLRRFQDFERLGDCSDSGGHG
jgi:hypothetical protein